MIALHLLVEQGKKHAMTFLRSKIPSIILNHMDIFVTHEQGSRKRFTDKIVMYHGSNDDQGTYVLPLSRRTPAQISCLAPGGTG